MSLNYLTNTEYITGNETGARNTCETALTSARDGSIHSMTAALNNSCHTLVFLGEIKLVWQYAEELVELSEPGESFASLRSAFFICSLTI